MHDETRIEQIAEPTETPRSWLSAPEAPVAATVWPTTARFAVSAAVLPRLEEVVAIGDRVRRALRSGGEGPRPLAVCHTAGRGTRGPRGALHERAWFLPADDDADGAIDHVVVHVPAGFDAAALRALARLRRVPGHRGGELALTLMDLGMPGELGCLRSEGLRVGLAPQLGTARVWESLTPFVPPRQVREHGGGGRAAPHEQVARLLASQGFSPAQVAALPARDITPPRPLSPIDWHQFERPRRSGRRRGASAGFGFRLHFDQPVTGPVALGEGAHHGLGQFVAVE